MASSQRRTLLPILLAVICLSGCASPQVRFLSSRCEASREKTRLKALGFVSSLETTGLQGEQLIYQVRLFDRSRAPLRSRDGRFQAADGTVAATTTMMVLQSPETVKDVRVSIPAGELGVPPNHLPVLAEVAVFKATGERVARVWCAVPPLKVAEIMPPMETRPTPYWFVKVADPNRLPVLSGPFATLAEAQAAATGGAEAPRQVNSDESLWFVPFYDPGKDGKAILVGPCLTEKDARDIAALAAQMPDLVARGLVAGAPVEVQLTQWLKEREVKGILSSHGAEAAESPPGERPQ
ncbi:MAG: hypothetical protein KA354_03005 [Phycisphaerae bacterium]|nr:hypothetical protein [Phycisphaerae bacterium]